MVEITICSGTLCHIMGGAELFEIEDKLSEIINEEINLKASVCLGHCQEPHKEKPPCITINNQLLPEATFEKIIRYLQK